jgi:hypothetical protein
MYFGWMQEYLELASRAGWMELADGRCISAG